MVGGSQHDRTEHSGSREITEGVTGGLGTEVGGTRNLRQGTGHTGGDIGNDRVEQETFHETTRYFSLHSSSR